MPIQWTASAGSADSTNTNYGGPFGFTSDDATRPVIIRQPQSRITPGQSVGGPYGLTQEQALGKTDQQTSTWQEYFDSVRQSVTDDPSSFKELQAKLYASGYFTPYLKSGQTPKFGRMDQSTISALNDMIGESVVSGKSIDQTLDDAKSSAPQTAKPVHLTNPADVAANAQQAAQSVLGQRLDPATVAAIQGRAESEATQTYDQSGGANVYDFSPSQAWLQEQLRQLMPNTTQAFQTSQNIGSFLKLVDPQGLFSAYHQ